MSAVLDLMDPLANIVGVGSAVIKLVQVVVQLCEAAAFNKSCASLLQERMAAIQALVASAPQNLHEYPAMRRLLAAIEGVRSLVEEWAGADKSRKLQVLRALKVMKFKGKFDDVIAKLDGAVRDFSAFMNVEVYNKVEDVGKMQQAAHQDATALVQLVVDAAKQDRQVLLDAMAQNGLSFEMLLDEVHQMGCNVQPLVEQMSSVVNGLDVKMDHILLSFNQMCAMTMEAMKERQRGHVKKRLPEPCLEKADLKDLQGSGVGAGGFGSVRLARYAGAWVAVKQAHAETLQNQHAVKELLKEAYLMSKLRGPKLVVFYGVVPEMNFALVMEHMQHGCLHTYLQQLKSGAGVADSGQFVSVDERRLQIALDAACAVEYLHGGSSPLGVVVHGDLKTSNLLVDGMGIVKLADYGCSVISNTHTRSLTTSIAGFMSVSKSALSMLYSAPEQLLAVPTGLAPPRNVLTDVYSLGAVLFEVFTCTVPFSHLPSYEAQQTAITQGWKPGNMRALYAANQVVAELVERCMSRDPAARPSATDVVDSLSALVSNQHTPPGPISGGMYAGAVIPPTQPSAALSSASTTLNSTQPSFLPSQPMQPISVSPQATWQNPELLTQPRQQPTSFASSLAEDAAGGMDMLSLNSSTPATEDEVVKSRARLAILVNELGSSSSDGVKERAASALWNLAFDPDNKRAIVHAGAINPLVSLLSSSSDDIKELAAGALRNLGADADNKRLIAQVGAIAPLVSLLSSSSDGVKERAAAALQNLAISPDNKRAIAHAGAITPLVSLLSSSSDGVKERAAGALGHLAVDADNRRAIAHAGAITPLVSLLSSSSDGVKEQAAGALWNLAVDPDNKRAIAQAGAITPLVSLLSSSSDGVKEQAAGALWNLAVDPDNRRPIAQAGAITPLVSLLSSSSDGVKELAAGALRNLAAAHAGAIKRAGAVPALKSMLQVSSHDGVRTHATALLKVLQSQ